MDPTLLRLLAVLAGIALTAAVGRLVAARRDRVRVVAGPASAVTGSDGGPHALLFGSPTCAPCETVKVLLREVADERDDFRWEYVDAADDLERARTHGVRRVPTLLVRDAEGTVVARSGGVPGRAELAAAVALAAGEPAGDDASPVLHATG